MNTHENIQVTFVSLYHPHLDITHHNPNYIHGKGDVIESEELITDELLNPDEFRAKYEGKVWTVTNYREIQFDDHIHIYLALKIKKGQRDLHDSCTTLKA